MNEQYEVMCEEIAETLIPFSSSLQAYFTVLASQLAFPVLKRADIERFVSYGVSIDVDLNCLESFVQGDWIFVDNKVPSGVVDSYNNVEYDLNSYGLKSDSGIKSLPGHLMPACRALSSICAVLDGFEHKGAERVYFFSQAVARAALAGTSRGRDFLHEDVRYAWLDSWWEECVQRWPQ